MTLGLLPPMKKLFKRSVIFMLTLGILLSLSVYLFLQHPQFGAKAEGERLQRVTNSPNYSDGRFWNIEPTAMYTGQTPQEGNALSRLFKFFMNRPEGLYPEGEIPSSKTDLSDLDSDRDFVIWFGHSSYLFQLDGKRYLVDPVFSEDAAPLPFLNEAFNGTHIYSPKDIPPVDYVLISHDHWDHLDYPTLQAIQPRVGKIITGLGVGAHIERWGYTDEQLIEADWSDSFEDESASIHVVPARHYSGRVLDRNQTLWVGFVIETPERRVYISGDSGYGKHIEQIHERFGRFDLVTIDHGQYDDRWANIHQTPEQAVQATKELNGDALLFNHIGKFSIANHPWQEPFSRLIKASQSEGVALLTPQIGEPVYFDDEEKVFTPWWESVE